MSSPYNQEYLDGVWEMIWTVIEHSNPIRYWAEVVDFDPANDEILLYEIEEDGTPFGPQLRFGRELIAEYIKRAITLSVGHDFAWADRLFDLTEWDDENTDVLMQLAVFEEVRYG